MALSLTGNLPDNGQALDAEILKAEFSNITENSNALISPSTGNIAMATNKITGLGAATANGDAVRYEQLGWNLLSRQTAASSPSINFTTGLTTTYNQYVFVLSEVVPAIDVAHLYMRVSQSLAFSAGSVYQWIRFGAAADSVSVGLANSPSDTQIVLASSLGNASGDVLAGEVRLWSPALTNVPKMFQWNISYVNSSEYVTATTGGGSATGLGLGAIDGVQFFMSGGNIAIGDFTLFGIRKT